MDFIRSMTIFDRNGTELKFNVHYASFSHWIVAQNMQSRLRVPKEIVNKIFELSGHVVWLPHGARSSRTGATAPNTPPNRHVGEGTVAPPPPANGSSPFNDSLPTELRRAILRESLPDRDQTIHPTCGSQFSPAPSTPQRANRLADLMLINKKMRDEITETVYEERTFGVHVHQGFQNAGIEFLHVGRQPLQYLDHSTDARFTKFRTGDMFGFCRLKKVEVRIFPPQHAEHKHIATNTYFMNLALVRLLQRNCENEANRMTSIRIVFVDSEPDMHLVGRKNMMATENPWWDTDKKCPRASSIHNLPDIQLVLRPFAQLSRCHSVEVQLPAKLNDHEPTRCFVVSLQRCMTGDPSQNTLNSDDLEKKIEAARYALEDYVSKTLFGGSDAHVRRISDEEMDDYGQGNASHDNDGNDDDDRGDNGNGNDGEDNDDDDDVDMDLPGGHGIRKESHHDKKHKATMASSTGMDGAANFDESGGFPKDLDAFDDSVEIAPNPTSEKVARFVECFKVTGDVARLYLGINGYDLDRASEFFMEMSDPRDAEQVAAAQLLEEYDGPAELSENQRGKLPDRREASKKREHHSDPSTPTKEEQEWNKNSKGKGRALANGDQDMPGVHEPVHGDDSLDTPLAAARRPAASRNTFSHYSLQPAAIMPSQPSDLADLMARPPPDPKTPTRPRGPRTQAHRIQDYRAARIDPQTGMPRPPLASGSLRGCFTGGRPLGRHDSLTSTSSGPDHFAPTHFPDHQRNQAPSTETGEDSGVEMPPNMRRDSSRTQQGPVQGSSCNPFASSSRPRGRAHGSGRFRGCQRSTFVPAQQSHEEVQQQRMQQLTQRAQDLQEQLDQGRALLATGLQRLQYDPSFGYLTAPHPPPQAPNASVPATTTTLATNGDAATPGPSNSTPSGDDEAMDVDSPDNSSPPGGAPLNPEQSRDSGF